MLPRVVCLISAWDWWWRVVVGLDRGKQRQTERTNKGVEIERSDLDRVCRKISCVDYCYGCMMDCNEVVVLAESSYFPVVRWKGLEDEVKQE